MANLLAALVKVHYQESVQENLEKTLTAMELAGMVDIPNGTTKNLPYVKAGYVGEYVKYSSNTASDINTGNDTIVINKTPYIQFALDMIDEGDDYIDVKPEVIADASYQIKKQIDGEFFSQVPNAKWKYDANGFGLNTGTLSPITLVTGASENISTVFGDASAGLASVGANSDMAKIVVDDFGTSKLTTLGMQMNGDVSSKSYTRGFRGQFVGKDVYASSCLYSSVIFDLATNPTNGDSFTILGVKFTFVSSIGTTAGNILIGAAAANTIDNLVALVNNPNTTTAQGVALDPDDSARLAGVTVTDGTTLATFTGKAWPLMATSTMTTAANDFQNQITYYSIMEKGAIKMALRNTVKVEPRDRSDNLVTNWHIFARYGISVTTRSKERMVAIPVISKAAEL